jgi:hypothetical protein
VTSVVGREGNFKRGGPLNRRIQGISENWDGPVHELSPIRGIRRSVEARLEEK